MNNKKKKNSICYDMDDFIVLSYPLFKSSEVACQRVFMPKGSIFPSHIHPNKEWIFVISGCFKMGTKQEQSKKYSVGEVAIFEANELHGGYMLEDTWILCLTIPADMKGYPDV